MLETQNITPSTTQRVLDNLKEVLFDRNGKLHFHLSFAEFLSSVKRSEKWVIKQETSHLKLFRACVNILERELKFNICHLETSYLTNRAVTDLSICERVTKFVPAELQYSSIHWTSHMVKAKEDFTLKNDLDSSCALNFMNNKRMIYWVECLSVMDKVSLIKSAVDDIKVWAKFTKVRSNIASEIAEGIEILVDSYSAAIVESTPHLYISALGWFIKQSLGPVLGQEGLQYHRKTRGLYRVGQPLQGHMNWVTSVAYSPDGRHMASGSDDHTVRIWDTQTGKQVGKSLQGHTKAVTSVAYSPDGKHVASGSNDHTIRIWNTQSKKQVGNSLQGHTGLITSVTYSPDGTHVASGSSDHTVRIWNTLTDKQVGQPLQGHTDLVTSVAYSPDGRYVASGSGDHTVKIWDTQTCKKVGQPPQDYTGSVTSVAYSPDGRHVVSGSDDHTVRIWD
ncbi:WD40 repeat-like protein, partial [Dendrothele bispora CBS 962.96]